MKREPEWQLSLSTQLIQRLMSRCCVSSQKDTMITLMRFVNFTNASIPKESENFLGNDSSHWRQSFGLDPDFARARVHLFVADYKHSKSKSKRATKTEERYLLLLRWISFHGILSNSIQSPPLWKALSVSSLSATFSVLLSPTTASRFSVFAFAASSSTHFSANYWFVS